jgi:competence protein ComEC
MKKIRIFVLSVFFISVVVCAFAQEQDLKIHFIDVGEGDSIFIQAPDGENALVDAGNLISGYRVIEYLKENGIQNLDYLIFTHPHVDHIGGAFFVLQMLDVESVYDNGEDLTEVAKYSDISRWYEELVRGGKNYKALKAGESILLGKATLSVLWPPQPPAFSDFNANSLVIMLEYGNFRCLLTGDLIIPGERKLLEQGTDLKADVLKVGHHGNTDASSEEFLVEVSPRIAIISASAEETLGQAAEEVLEKFKDIGAEVYRTDRDGDIVLSIYLSKVGKPKINVEKSR